MKCLTAVECYRFIEWLPDEPYLIQSIETTTFSTNKALLLGSFKHATIRKSSNYYDEIAKPLPADVTIVRVSNGTESQNTSQVIVVPTWKVELNRATALIKLPTPIIIDPKFKYEIRMNLNAPRDYEVYHHMKSEVQLSDGIIVKFHNDPEVNGKIKGVIYNLVFGRVD